MMCHISNWSSLKIVLAFLSVNIFWLLKVYPPAGDAAQRCPPTPQSPVAPLNNIDGFVVPNNSASLAFDNIDLSYGRWDNQQLYRIKDFALLGEQYVYSSEGSLVCLATQTSVERLNSLPQVAANWQGKMSVALFAAGPEEFVVLQYFVTYMRLGKFDCQYPDRTLKALLKFRSLKTLQWRQRNTYPQNHMRNLARKGCQTKYVFLTDIDIVPSTNSVPQLNHFLRTANCTKSCAYVIPTFEIDVRATFPRSKNALVRLIRKGLARPFHEKVFIYNQYATNFSKWLSSNTNDTEVSVSHIVTNFEFLYEPFYISVDNAPAHDERFLGYGFTRNSQVYEMHIAGYQFYVLSPVFTGHWGLQRKQARPAWREQQNNANRRKFDVFKSEIFVRYKNDPRLLLKAKKNQILVK
ncbi:GM18308 [Drosophila sechellia]|uniref:Beta-1,4-glucuronyltransferase 1 n=1 Tax=Drosophila sechellia TaxID=7238 RepID=B4I2D7_DROSE|nr:GM18308 [Drosophila sechellia]